MHNEDRSHPALLAIALLALVAPAASAAPINRAFASNAPGLCQAALPAFEGLIRKRPLSVQNEGTANAFVTCSFTSQVTGVTKASVSFHSVDGLTHPVSCTGVSGYIGNSVAVVNGGTVAATGQSTLIWSASDFGGATFPGLGRFSVSCAIPPNIGIDDLQIDFSEEIGA